MERAAVAPREAVQSGVHAPPRAASRGGPATSITDALSVEHRLFLSLFDSIRNLAVANPAGERVRGACLTVAKALESHARLEEELLLPALEPHLGLAAPELLAIHRDEHRKIDRQFAHAVAAVSVVSGGIDEAIDYALAHFEKEERALFALARRQVSASHLVRLGQCMAESRGARHG